MDPLFFQLPSSGLDLRPDLVEDMKVGLHLLGEKIELAIAFSGWCDEIVLLKCSNMMLCELIVIVEGVSELVDVARLLTEEIDDLGGIWLAMGPGEKVP